MIRNFDSAISLSLIFGHKNKIKKRINVAISVTMCLHLFWAKYLAFKYENPKNIATKNTDIKIYSVIRMF